ncbi:MAG: glycosyltransferase family 4 protein [Candidatus Omnitrophica bacterium]|nr:glycosyltransferase family 4 protein [Candidatus Omnitrophota bacterium]
MTKVLLICDKRDWAYDSIAKALVKYNDRKGLALDIYYIKADGRSLKEIHKSYDLCFFIGWQLIFAERRGLFGTGRRYKKRFPFIDDDKILTGIHSHHAWDKRETTPDKDVKPPRKLISALERCHGVNVVSKRLYSIFKDSGLKNISYTPNGVDTELFLPTEPVKEDGELRVGYSGSLKHDWRKGITELIEPACKMAGVEFKKAMPSDGHYVPLDDMPRFYNGIELYLCASSSEGFSLSVLEASACGRPVVSTRVGGCVDLVQDNDNGFLVNRDVKDIADKLRFFSDKRSRLTEMGRRNREIIEDKWSWKKRACDWLDFIERNTG